MQSFPRIVLCALIALASAVSQVEATEHPTWLAAGKPSRQAAQLLEIMDGADSYGLRPADYRLALAASELQAVRAGHADPSLQSRFDRALTASVARFATHIHQGRVTAQAAGFDLPAPRSTLDAANAVRQLAMASNPRDVIAALEPRPRPYHALKQALRTYRTLALQPGLHRLPPLPQRSIGIGDDYAGASSLRRLLVALGDLNAAPSDGNKIDASLEAALRHFQERHGLNPDGVIGARTYEALTTPLSRRVQQIELTLERWRWLAGLQQRPDIVVNIPQFTLYTLPAPNLPDANPLEMQVIVGRVRDRTPIFAAQIQEVVFQPYWDVPSSILRKELLPKIRKDPSYLERHHFEIVRGAGDDAAVVAPSSAALSALAAGQLRLRQRPGPDNALGPVKFVLPNPYNVRLHGTPEQALFAQPSRAFSHGCIRVSAPAALAQFVLRNAADEWDEERVETAMCGTQTLRIKLALPVRVIVFYATAAATESRGVLFSDDIYGHDRRLERLLDAASNRGAT
jgi:murein L,D-transpeptidase YcbB/YkuD